MMSKEIRHSRINKKLFLVLLFVVQGSIGLQSEVQVRFTNTPNGKDIETVAPAGTNLLALGDDAGVRLPRACRNGLCNSCVCDVVDQSTGTRTTIKACSTKIMPHADGSPIIVDVYRMQKASDQVMAKSMRRFDDGWENDFVPDYKRGNGPSSIPSNNRAGAYNTQQGLPPWEQYASTPASQQKPTPQPETYDPKNPNVDDPLAAPWDRIW